MGYFSEVPPVDGKSCPSLQPGDDLSRPVFSLAASQGTAKVKAEKWEEDGSSMP